MALTDWVQTGAVIYFAWQQNRIFSRQNEIFASQSKKTAVAAKPTRLVEFKRYWPTLAMVAVMLLTAYDIYDRNHTKFGYDPQLAWDHTKPLERIFNAHLANQTVVVDGKTFINPVFDNVTFLYKGIGPFSMENALFVLHDGKMTSLVTSQNPVVKASFKLHCALAQAAGCQSSCVTEDANYLQNQ